MNLWRTFEFRGRDPNDNPFVDFGFVEVKEDRLALTSHMLRKPLWVDSTPQVMPTFKRYYGARLLEAAIQGPLAGWGPVDAPLMRGGRYQSVNL
jgi:hypothetical protein